MKRSLSLVSSFCAIAISTASYAQSTSVSTPTLIGEDGATAPEATSAGDIVVTGRKRTERLLQAPLSITAYSTEKLEQLDLHSIGQLGTITPGFKFEQQSFSNGFRLLAQIRFRGVIAGNPRPNNQPGAIFIDGAYIAAGSASLNTDDVERVEVIKGPQSAYFGRNTFAGAVNFITRVPTEDFHVTGKAEYKSFGGYAFGASAEGTLLPEVLTGRVMVQSFRNGGQFDSGDGEKVGAQETKSVTGTLYFTPGDRLKMRARVSYQHDEDWGNLIMNYSGNVPGCKIGAVAYFCGAIPHVGDSYTTPSGQVVKITKALANQDTSLIAPALVAAGRPNALVDLLNNVNGVLNDVPILGKVPLIDHFGSEDTVLRTSLVTDYDFGGGFAAASNIGYGEFRSSSLRDNDSVLGYTATRPNCAATLSATARQACILQITQFLLVPFLARDFSADLRISSPRDKRVRVMLGVSYFKQWLDGNISGAGKSLSAGTGLATAFINNDRDRSYAAGVFGSLSVDILRTLTLDLEARYQKDAARQFTQTGSFAAGTIGYSPLSYDFNKFLPRAILNWKPNSSTTVYGSYAVGALAGISNVSLNNLVASIARNPRNALGTTDPAAIRTALAKLLGYPGTIPDLVPAQKLKQIELGWKQSFWGGKGSFTLAGYHIDWSNIQTTAALLATQDLDGSGVLTPINAILPGKARIWGGEASLNLQPTSRVSMSLQGEITDAKYTDYTIYGVGAQVATNGSVLSGVGKTPLQYPTFSLFGMARYTMPVSDEVSVYGQVENNLVGKQYLDEANVAWIAPYDTVNLRTGFTYKEYSIEAYVTNLFDYSGPAGGRRNTLGDGTTGVTIFPAPLRTFGMRASVKF